MRFLKLIVISILLLFLLLTAFSSLLPSQVRISRAVDINTSNEKLRNELLNLENWSQWNEFIKMLPDQNITQRRITTNQLTVTLDKFSKNVVTTQWVQQNGKTFPAVFNIISQDSLTTTLQWYFDFRFRWYPWEKFSSIIYDRQLGPQMEQSLLSLKQLLEKAS